MGDVNLLKADAVTVTVARQLTDDGHSFRQWQDTEHGQQVQLEGGFTHFTVDGDRFVFTGVRWFPQLFDDYLDADVDLHRVGDDHHIASVIGRDDFRLRDLVTALENGRLEPASALSREAEV